MAGVVTINDLNVDSDAYELFDVFIYNARVETLVTKTPSMVESWISDVERIHRRRLNRLIVGIDVEWLPNRSSRRNPVATLQLCVGHLCLVFQILHAHSIPDALFSFLDDSDYSFVGVGVEKDAEKLLEDYGLRVRKTVDLGDLAAAEYGDRSVKNLGLMRLAGMVHGMDIEKPRHVTMSHWDEYWLNYDQVQYACVDAWVSFMIGKKLITGS